MGMPSARELLQRVSSTELTELMAYARLEPFGGPFDDYRFGLAPATALNMNRAEGKPPLGPLELFPWHQMADAEEPATPDQIAAGVKGLITTMTQGVQR